MRAYIAGPLLYVAMLSGCFGPSDAGAPAPNYNPAAERDDYPEPEGSDRRSPDATSAGAAETSEANAPPQPSDAPADNPLGSESSPPPATPQ